MGRLHVKKILLVTMAAFLFSSLQTITVPAFAADTYEIKAVAVTRAGAQWKKWDWLAQELDKRTNGRLKLKSTTTTTELGLKGTEITRVLKTGVVDLAEVFAAYVAGDVPIIEAPDLPGVSSSFQQSRDIYKVWAEKVMVPRENLLGGKIIGNFSYNSVYVYTKFPVNSLDDLKGKKIRVFSAAMANYVSNLGMEPVSMPVGEVYSAVQRGIVDAIATGPDQVKGMSMWEIANNMMELGFSAPGCYLVMSRKVFDKLPADIQKVLVDIGPEFTELAWNLGQENNEKGLALAREKGMNIIEAKPEWVAKFKDVSQNKVIPAWVEIVGEEGRTEFNQYIAPIVGFEAK